MNIEDLTKLTQAMVAAESDVVAAEENLKSKKAALARLREEDIPAAMTELELTKIVLDSGEELTIATEVYAGIAVADRESAYGWLEEHGFSGLIKGELLIEFSRLELPRAGTLVKELIAAGHPAVLAKSIHASTLKAFVKEQLSTPEFPAELFGARSVKVAKLKSAKKAKDEKRKASA